MAKAGIEGARPRSLSRQKEKNPIQTNCAGAIYKRLYDVRSDFLHGNPVTAETLKLAKRQESVLVSAAPLFRLALTAVLDLRSPELSDASADQDYDPIAGGCLSAGLSSSQRMRSSWPTKPTRWRAEGRKPGKSSAVPAQAAAQALPSQPVRRDVRQKPAPHRLMSPAAQASV
jgi:hypothetical protein